MTAVLTLMLGDAKPTFSPRREKGGMGEGRRCDLGPEDQEPRTTWQIKRHGRDEGGAGTRRGNSIPQSSLRLSSHPAGLSNAIAQNRRVRSVCKDAPTLSQALQQRAPGRRRDD